MKKIMLLIFFLISSLSFALKLSTISYNERIDNYEGYKEITIYNTSTSPKIYGFKILPSEVKSDKMYQWTHLSDSEVTIPPLDSYNLRIYSKSPEKTPEGQYDCYLKITPVIITKSTKSDMVTIPIILNIKLSGYVGKLNYNKNFIVNNLKIENIKNSEKIIGEVKNNCFANIETSAKLLNSSGISLFDNYLGVIERNKNFKIDFKIPKYVNVKDIKYIEFHNFNNSDVIKKIAI
ncbi:hypothetical protein ACWMNP_11995 (plasmid) [Cetobacterium ceti]